VSRQTERLIRSGERMRQLLDDLLDYNRTSLQVGLRVSPEPLDLCKLCNEELDLLRAAWPRSRIEFTSPGAAHGHWDASRIKQVISNLVSNAAKYGDPDGTIRIELRQQDGATELVVENAGPTIPPALLHTLFEPLRRHSLDIQGPRESLGLGLYIARQVALAHGGDIVAESADGHTRFTVNLPPT
jgi:signal transduction histidine kinase